MPTSLLRRLCLFGMAALSASGRAEVLTLQDALRLAEANNGALENARLGVGIAQDRLGEARSYFRPQLRATVVAGELLTPVDFSFSRGLFGLYPGIGPIPANDTVIRTPRRLAMTGLAQLAQPLSQLYRIGLTVDLAGVGVRASTEELKARQQTTRQQVKAVYFGIIQAQTAARAASEAVRFTDELTRLAREALAAKTVLPGEVTTVEARHADAQQQLLVAQGEESTNRERLNFLLGRPLATAFEIESEPTPFVLRIDLEEARRRARVARPELAQARLGIEQAELKRRIARSEYIPDISLTVSAVKFEQVEFLPNTVTSAGVLVQWDMFDGGRRRHRLASETRALQQARRLADDAEAQIAIEVGAAHRKLEQSEARLRAARLKRDAEAEQLRVTMNLFGQKQAPLRDVLGQRTNFEAATLDYQQALAGVWNASADLEKAIGGN